MGRAGVDIDGIGGTRIVGAAIGIHDPYVSQMRQVGARTAGQLLIALDRGYAPARSDDVGENRRVVTGTAADVDDVLTGLRVECIDPQRVSAWLSVVEKARRVDRDQYVAIQMDRIGVGRGGGLQTQIHDFPRSWYEKMLTLNPSECANQRR